MPYYLVSIFKIGLLSLLCTCLSACNPIISIVSSPQTSKIPLSGSSEAQREKCIVLFINDGDTFACDINGDNRHQKPRETIRLLGIDAPEMHYSRKNKSGRNQPYAQEATNYLAAYKGKTLWLEYDQQKSDRYGRTLAYVYANPTSKQSFNELLLRKGYAKLLFLGDNRCYEALFLEAALEARHQQRGLHQALPKP